MNLPVFRAVETIPSHIAVEHFEEWAVGSAVDPEIIALNVETIRDTQIDVLSREVSHPIAERLNWKISAGYKLHENRKGWWVSGIDPLNNYQRMEWGRFKPDSETPIYDAKKGSNAKYLSPAEQASRLVFLETPQHIWQKISDRTGIAISRNNFWQWVIECNVPIVLCEGEKKAGSLLTQGYAAISGPGIDNFTLVYDEQGNRLIQPLLRPDLVPFVNSEREITILFDYDHRPKVVRRINQAIGRIYWALVKAGSDPKVSRLPGPDKGVDDFVIAQGSEALEKVLKRAKALSDDRVERFSALTFPVAQTLNRRYLDSDTEPLEIPENEKFICVRSPKGTGKSTWLKKVVDSAQNQDIPIPVVIINHRVQLGQALCESLGLPFVSDLRETEEGKLFGFGLCVDSAHPNSQARFKADHYDDCILVLDEVEQLVRHVLFATTDIRHHRTVVLKELENLFINVLTSDKGKIIASDADLCNISIQFILGMAQSKINPYIVDNQWKPTEEAWTVHCYEQNTPKEWLAKLCDEVEFADGAIFVETQSQEADSTWSAQNLEKQLSERFPNKRILRADADTVADQSHPAFGIAARINEEVKNWDIIIATPTLETGVSIDIRGHFQSVWGVFWGVSHTDSARQFLARVRDSVPRHVWAAKRGVKQFANGETSLYKILKNQKLLATRHLKSIREACETFDPEVGFVQNPTAINTWGKIACIHNVDQLAYRENLFEGLAEEGHTIVDAELESLNNPVELYEELREIKQTAAKAEHQAVSEAGDITENQYNLLSRKRSKTKQERYQERKYELQQRYQVPVDPELVSRDRDGWYSQIRLHYYLLVGRMFLMERDRAKVQSMAEKSKELWMPTMNYSLLSLQVQALEFLGIPDLIRPEYRPSDLAKPQEYRATDRDIVEMIRLAKRYREDLKLVLGVKISEKDESPFKSLNLILDKFGMKLKCDRQETDKSGKRIRVYRLEAIQDGREEVFAGWLQRDILKRSQSEMHTTFNISNKGDSKEACAA